MKSAALILGLLISAPFANSWYTIRMSDFNLVDFSQASTIVIQPEDGQNRQVGEG